MFQFSLEPPKKFIGERKENKKKKDGGFSCSDSSWENRASSSFSFTGFYDYLNLSLYSVFVCSSFLWSCLDAEMSECDEENILALDR